MKTNKPIKSIARLAFFMPAVAVLLISLSSCKKSIESEQVINNERSKDVSGSVSAITVNVKTQAGAVGDGVSDDTDNFNTAINMVVAGGGGTVYVPAGTYLINPDISIRMKSNVILNMVDTTTRILKVKPSSQDRYNVIRMHGISNAEVKFGRINGERLQHIGTTGEHGMGISIYGSSNCKVANTVITNCWGDGITISSSNTYNVPNQAYNIRIWNVRSRKNRRQGLTIGNADSVVVAQSHFTHTGDIINSSGNTIQLGTNPRAGIDIEPDQGGVAERIHILNCTISHNQRCGVEMNQQNDGTGRLINKVTATGNTIEDNTYSFYMINLSNTKIQYNSLKLNRVKNIPHRAGAWSNVDIEPNTY